VNKVEKALAEIKNARKYDVEGLTDGEKLLAKAKVELFSGQRESGNSMFNLYGLLGSSSKKRDDISAVKQSQELTDMQLRAQALDFEAVMKEMESASRKAFFDVSNFGDFMSRREALGRTTAPEVAEKMKLEWEKLDTDKFIGDKLSSVSKERGKAVDIGLSKDITAQMADTGLNRSELGKLVAGLMDVSTAGGKIAMVKPTMGSEQQKAVDTVFTDAVRAKYEDIDVQTHEMFKSEELKFLEAIDTAAKAGGISETTRLTAKGKYMASVTKKEGDEFARNMKMAGLNEQDKKKAELQEQYGPEWGARKFTNQQKIEGAQAITNRKTEYETAGMSEMDKNLILYTRQFGEETAKTLVEMDKAKNAKDALYSADLKLSTAGMPEYLAKIEENTLRMSRADAEAVSKKEMLTDFTKQLAEANREVAALSTMDIFEAQKRRLIDSKGFTPEMADQIVGADQMKKSLEKTRTLKLEFDKALLPVEADKQALAVEQEVGKKYAAPLAEIARQTVVMRELEMARLAASKAGATEAEDKIITASQKVGAEYGRQIGMLQSRSDAYKAGIDSVRAYGRAVATATDGNDKLFDAVNVKGWSMEIAKAQQNVEFATKTATKLLDMRKELDGIGGERAKLYADTRREVGGGNVDKVMETKDRLGMLQGVKAAYDSIIKSGYTEYQASVYDLSQKHSKADAERLAQLKLQADAYKAVSDSLSKYQDTLAEYQATGGGKRNELRRKGVSETDIGRMEYADSAVKGLERLKGLKDQLKDLGGDSMLSVKARKVDEETGVKGLGARTVAIEKEIEASKDLIAARNELSKAGLSERESAMLDNMQKYGEVVGLQISKTQELTKAKLKLAEAKTGAEEYLIGVKNEEILSRLTDKERELYDVVSKFSSQGKVFDEIGAKQAIMIEKQRELAKISSDMYKDMGDKATDFFAKISTGSVEEAGGFKALFQSLRDGWKAGRQAMAKKDIEAMFSGGTEDMSAQDIIDRAETGMSRPRDEKAADIEKVRAIYNESNAALEATVSAATTKLGAELDTTVGTLTAQVSTFGTSMQEEMTKNITALNTELNTGTQALSADITGSVNTLSASVASMGDTFGVGIATTNNEIITLYQTLASSAESLVTSVTTSMTQAAESMATAAAAQPTPALTNEVSGTVTPLTGNIPAIPKDLVQNRTKYIPFKGKQADYVQSHTGTYVGSYITKQLLGNDYLRSASFADKFHQVENKSSDHNKGLAYDITLAKGTLENSRKQADAIVAMYKNLGMSVLVGKGQKAGRDVQVLNEYDPKMRTKHATGGHIHVGFSPEAAKKLEMLAAKSDGKPVTQSAPMPVSVVSDKSVSAMLGKDNATKYDALIAAAAQKNGLDASVLKAQIWQESKFNPNAKNSIGAGGLMQIMPKTAPDLGLSQSDRFDPEKSINAGAKYMGQLMKRYNGDIELALSAYNAGMGTIDKALKQGRRTANNKENAHYAKGILNKAQEIGGVQTSVSKGAAEKLSENTAKQVGAAAAAAVNKQLRTDVTAATAKLETLRKAPNAMISDVAAKKEKAEADVKVIKVTSPQAKLEVPVVQKIELPDIKPLNAAIATMATSITDKLRPTVETVKAPTTIDSYIQNKQIVTTQASDVKALNTNIQVLSDNAMQSFRTDVVKALNEGGDIKAAKLTEEATAASAKFLESIKAAGIDPVLYQAASDQQAAFLQQYAALVGQGVAEVANASSVMAKQALDKSKATAMEGMKTVDTATFGAVPKSIKTFMQETPDTAKYDRTYDLMDGILNKSFESMRSAITTTTEQAIQAGGTLDVAGIMQQVEAENVRNMAILDVSGNKETIAAVQEQQQASTTAFSDFLAQVSAYLEANS